MLQHAWSLGVPMRWVVADEVYGQSPALRDVIAGAGRWYLMGVRATTPVWTQRPAVERPGAPSSGRPRGRPRTNARLAKGAPGAITVAAVVARWPEGRWRRLTVAEGEKGPLTYDWGRQRVIESHDGLPGREGWLLARRSLDDAKGDLASIAYYLSNAPAGISLPTLARIASTRYTVEQCIEEAKGETGLDEYEVRYWHSWHRHITLSMMAHAWLASVRHKAMAKKGDPSPSWPS
jgi:SRSO17 transposase